ncbi:protein delta homolog 2 isoform X1 [Dunckerocampus dactyliophorus]|uniref:protein delta homolog 2 isoform X1 n=1 Tax=Dunckerocampus dactyliophorus TaxID=161453 RepID=UPI00240557CF|nr:protein delta homolog 2 isoform X1 [Dunckerocampus dactyliophorus]
MLSCILLLLVLPAKCDGEGLSSGDECSCDTSNSRCDDSGACRCDPGWEGEHCQRCVPTPGCVHGSCRRPWQCECLPGWGGRFCDKDLDACSRQPCHNGATCVMDDGGEFTCVCPPDFYGPNCQLKAGPCLQNRSACQNGGQCEDDHGFAAQLTCRCLAGFSGPRCETDVDDCAMAPCANGATCLDAINRFLCVCPTGFTGRFCTVNMDDCASRPCLNAARCLDLAGSFRCVCRPGFAGLTCDVALQTSNGREWRGHQLTKGGSSNSTDAIDVLFRVTLSERSVGLSRAEIISLLVLVGVTSGAVALTATFVLHAHCRACGHAPWRRRRAQQNYADSRINFLHAADRKLNCDPAHTGPSCYVNER